MSSRRKQIIPASKLPSSKKKPAGKTSARTSSETGKKKKASRPKRVQTKIKEPKPRSRKKDTDSFLEVSEIDDISEYTGSEADFSDFEAHLSEIVGGSSDAEIIDHSNDDDTVDGGAKSTEDASEKKKPSAKPKGKKAAASTIPTPIEIIKLSTEGMVRIKKREYKTLKVNSFIKYVNQNGYLTRGSYIHSTNAQDDGEHEIRKSWLMGMNPLGSGARGFTFTVFWDSIQDVYLELDEEREQIKRALDDKQRYINDIATFLLSKYGDEFRDYMEARERQHIDNRKKRSEDARRAKKQYQKKIRAAESRASSEEESSEVSESSEDTSRSHRRKK
jgi:hypothetical protein